MEQIDPDDPLRRLGVPEDVVVLGPLPEHAARQLALPTSLRTVCLHPDTAFHIYTERGFQGGEAAFVFSHLPRVIREPHFCGCDPRARGRYDRVHLPEERGRPVFAALKRVEAAVALSGRDELWVSTAHRLPQNFLSRKRYRHSLRPLEGLDAAAWG